MPNFSTYQTLCKGLQYSQFPLDHSVEIIKNNAYHCQSECKLVIFRQEQQMYYQFVWKIAENQYVGAVIILSNRCFCELDKLVFAFLHTLKSAATENYLSHTDSHIQIIANELNESVVKIDEFETILSDSLPEIKPLSQLKIGTDINEYKVFNINSLDAYNNAKKRIVDSSISLGCTIVNLSDFQKFYEEFEMALLPHNESGIIDEEQLTPKQIYKFAEFNGQNGEKALKDKIKEIETKIKLYEDRIEVYQSAGYSLYVTKKRLETLRIQLTEFNQELLRYTIKIRKNNTSKETNNTTVIVLVIFWLLIVFIIFLSFSFK